MKKGFTLVELIVVISILAILGTVGFVMLGAYNKDARDAKRLADISNIEKSMELFFTKEGIYPDPTSFTTVTYSGAEVWKQGTIGDDVINLLGNINYKPVDPLTQTEYSYSLLNTGEKYELGVLLEGNLVAGVLPNAYAASKKGFSYVRGNFNKAIVEVSTGGLVYALAIPTIIVSDLTNPDIMNIIASKKLAFNGYSNIPETYSKLGYKTQGGFDFNSVNPSSTILYQGTNISELSTSGPSLKTFSDKLIAAYSGTTLNTTGIYKQILGVDTTITAQINTVISPLINQSLGLNLATTNTVVNNQGGGTPPPITYTANDLFTSCNTCGVISLITDANGGTITSFDSGDFEITSGIGGNMFNDSDVLDINIGIFTATDLWQDTNPTGPLYVLCDNSSDYWLAPTLGCLDCSQNGNGIDSSTNPYTCNP